MNPDMSIWTGRDDTPTEGPNALRWWQCVKPYSPDAEPGIVLIGFACDEGVRRNGGRVGAKDGPQALRKALANMAWHRDCPVFDCGDVVCEGQDMEGAQTRLAAAVSTICKDHHLPVVFGGGHETAWGTFQGLTQAYPGRTIGIVNIDAHLDLRQSSVANSGTPFRQIADWCRENSRPFHYLCMGVCGLSNTAALFETASQLGVDIVYNVDMQMWRFNRVMKAIQSLILAVDVIHLSIDLDVLSSTIMPAVSAPATLGVTLEAVESVAHFIALSEKLAAIDIVEFNPTYDLSGQAAKSAVWTLNGIDRAGFVPSANQ